MSENPQEKKENNPILTNVDDHNIEPYVLFNYSIRSPQTKDSYFRRLRTFFEYAKIEGNSFREKCNNFVEWGHQYPNQAVKLIFEFLQFQKQRVERKDITSGTLKNYQKTIKSFCEMTDVLVPWKKIIKGLPRGKRFADDRAPTLEEIQKIVEYPDRRIKPIVCVMASSGIRVGAWDYLKWGHVIPIFNNDDKTDIIAAKLRVYADEDDEYYTFISSEAYLLLKCWVDFREKSGEKITNESWIMRTLWNSEKIERITKKKNDISNPEKLSSVGIKRLIERALWTQNLRTKINSNSKRYEFQTDHGFRKFFKTRCEIGGMKPINIEKLMGHSVGISDSYYRATEHELLDDYLKVIRNLIISNEIADKIRTRENEIDNVELKSMIAKKGNEILILQEQSEYNKDTIAALSDRIAELIEDIQHLKNISGKQITD